MEQRFERNRRSEGKGGSVGQSTPDICNMDLYYQHLTDKIQRSTMETSVSIEFVIGGYKQLFEVIQI